MDRSTNGLFIAMAGTLATVGLYSRLSHKAEKKRRGGDLQHLPTIDFAYVPLRPMVANSLLRFD